MKKVTGIGGIFFKCKDPKKINEWYKTHLGIDAGQYGASFEWREDEDPTKKGITQWSAFAETTKYFEPSTKDFMINYRVDNLEALVEQLKNVGVTIVDKLRLLTMANLFILLMLKATRLNFGSQSSRMSDGYSARRLFTGFTIAALTTCKLIVAMAMMIAASADITKTHQLILIL
jgi:catechol 2,3-dioxygenase-like lactoylglutathione lyase family enzyme